jgi:hypothetical protein
LSSSKYSGVLKDSESPTLGVGVSSSHFTQSRVATEKALKGKNAKKWEITMEEKYNFLVVNSTWSLMPFPKGRKPISCKWVFKIKHGVDGEIKCHKARIVAKGFTQTFGVNYDETFAPDAKFESIRCILALTIIEDMEIHQMDIKITFFNGDLKEEIYMEQLEGFTHEGKHFMCKVHKSLYRLKQLPRAWNQNLNIFLKNIEFVRSDADFGMYVVTPLWAKCEDEIHTPESGDLKSSGTPENSELDCRGQNTSHRGVLYINGKVLKCRSKMALHDPFGHL